MGLQKTALPKEVSDQLTTEELEAALREMAGPDADDGDIELEAALREHLMVEPDTDDVESPQLLPTRNWKLPLLPMQNKKEQPQTLRTNRQRQYIPLVRTMYPTWI